MSATARALTRWTLLLLGAALVLALAGPTAAQAAHGGSVPTYGTGTDCTLVNFTYDDGHTDHFYACGFGNDLTPQEIPDLHVTELHVSCSDVFPEGEFQKGDPTSAEEPSHEHTVARYRIEIYKDFGTPEEEIDKECGEVFVPLTVDVCVDLVNDASGDDDYSDDETATAEGADVPERVTVTNCGDTPHTIDDVTIDGDPVCPELLGMVQQPGESATCDLVQPSHTPAEDVIEIDTVTVTVHHPDDEQVTATDDDPTAMTTVVPPTPPVDVCVDLVNDASGDGTYSDDEVADEPGLDVPERVTVTNCGDAPHIIDELAVASAGGTPIDVCPSLIGMELAAGDSTTCDLVQPDHTPGVNEVKTDEVSVLVHHPDDASLTATDTDPTAMTVRADTLVGAGDQERDPETEPAAEATPETDPEVEADELAATGARAEIGLTGLTSMALGLLLLLGATAIVRQARYARDDIRRFIQRG